MILTNRISKRINRIILSNEHTALFKVNCGFIISLLSDTTDITYTYSFVKSFNKKYEVLFPLPWVLQTNKDYINGYDISRDIRSFIRTGQWVNIDLYIERNENTRLVEPFINNLECLREEIFDEILIKE